MKRTAILWLFLGLVLQVDLLQAGPVNVVSDLEDFAEEEVNELELSGSGMFAEQKDEEYINSSKRSSPVVCITDSISHGKFNYSYRATKGDTRHARP